VIEAPFQRGGVIEAPFQKGEVFSIPSFRSFSKAQKKIITLNL